MTSGAASSRARISALFHDPQRTMARALTGSRPGRLLALVTIPLWLTPEIYYQYLRPSQSHFARSALWTAAGLWFGTVTLASLPVVPILQVTVSGFGKRIGYWDDQFTAPTITLLLTTLFCSLIIVLAIFEWLHTWVACIIDAAHGGRTISPPPFGYFAIRIAGEIATLAIFASALFFSVRPLNAPIWRWLESTPLFKIFVIVNISAAVLVASDRKICTIQICAQEIYGSRSKAAIYQLGGCLVVFALLCLFTAHYRH